MMLLLGRELLAAGMMGISKMPDPCCLHPCHASSASPELFSGANVLLGL